VYFDIPADSMALAVGSHAKTMKNMQKLMS